MAKAQGLIPSSNPPAITAKRVFDRRRWLSGWGVIKTGGRISAGCLAAGRLAFVRILHDTAGDPDAMKGANRVVGAEDDEVGEEAGTIARFEGNGKVGATARRYAGGADGGGETGAGGGDGQNR